MPMGGMQMMERHDGEEPPEKPDGDSSNTPPEMPNNKENTNQMINDTKNIKSFKRNDQR